MLDKRFLENKSNILLTGIKYQKYVIAYLHLQNLLFSYSKCKLPVFNQKDEYPNKILTKSAIYNSAQNHQYFSIINNI